MESSGKKIWKKVAVAGLLLSVLCLAVCIFQFHSDSHAGGFRKLLRIAMNFIAVNFFLFLTFSPMSFACYGLIFFVYGCGNFIDGGNVLGTACILTAFIFFGASGFFGKQRKARIFMLTVPPFLSLFSQLFIYGKGSLAISLMNNAGALYAIFISWLILVPEVKKECSSEFEKYMSPQKFSERDIEFLELVLRGEKYGKIASLYSISESSVKAAMLELYHHLGVKNRTEFLATFSGCTFMLGNSDG